MKKLNHQILTEVIDNLTKAHDSNDASTLAVEVEEAITALNEISSSEHPEVLDLIDFFEVKHIGSDITLDPSGRPQEYIVLMSESQAFKVVSELKVVDNNRYSVIHWRVWGKTITDPIHFFELCKNKKEKK
jgi:hypothetical protein